VAEWSIAPVLKTGNPQGFVSSNLTASAKLPLSFFMVLNASLGVLFDKLSQSIGVNAKELLPLTKGTATCMNY
jgi:hypothetical protein